MLIQAIDEYLSKRPKTERLKFCFHPSNLHKSPRELYDLYLNGGSNKEFEARILRVFDNGHAVHNRLKEYLHKTGLLIQTEVPAENDEYEIRGHTDGIIDIRGVQGVLEIKSMNSTQFYSCSDPKQDHLIDLDE